MSNKVKLSDLVGEIEVASYDISDLTFETTVEPMKERVFMRVVGHWPDDYSETVYWTEMSEFDAIKMFNSICAACTLQDTVRLNTKIATIMSRNVVQYDPEFGFCFEDVSSVTKLIGENDAL